MVFETQETSQQVNGDVIRLTLPTAKSTSLEYVDEENGNTLLVIDLVKAQMKIEEVCKTRGDEDTQNWLRDFADWLGELGDKTITPSQAWFIARDVKIMYEELKKNYNQSRTLLSGIMSTPTTEPSQQ